MLSLSSFINSAAFLIGCTVHQAQRSTSQLPVVLLPTQSILMFQLQIQMTGCLFLLHLLHHWLTHRRTFSDSSCNLTQVKGNACYLSTRHKCWLCNCTRLYRPLWQWLKNYYYKIMRPFHTPLPKKAQIKLLPIAQHTDRFTQDVWTMKLIWQVLNVNHFLTGQLSWWLLEPLLWWRSSHRAPYWPCQACPAEPSACGWWCPQSGCGAFSLHSPPSQPYWTLPRSLREQEWVWNR